MFCLSAERNFIPALSGSEKEHCNPMFNVQRISEFDLNFHP